MRRWIDRRSIAIDRRKLLVEYFDNEFVKRSQIGGRAGGLIAPE
jgi:hypothetical protein